ncbi:malectin domain-containing carbohydrate-binding protein [uncultured Roseobacter sp.]|uniref:malectin domain-containing carbohydrate-binding protein n=1 Tax=uncultured Roseobacter sp. TaxID=114847 RepID=UPI0026032C99|nr:malectin domain-containing carbohydrate-binding protein [uncultured Roseobacter sp.]
MIQTNSVTFSVVNTQTDTVLDKDLSEGETIDPGTIGITVDAPDAVGSVRFTLNGDVERVENVAPHALFGDTKGDFFNGELPSGDHTIIAEFFEGKNASGDALGSATRTFSVAEPTEPAPTPITPTPPESGTLADWADHIVFQFDGNNNDPDDITALVVAGLLTKASGTEDKTTFLYGNNLSEPNDDDQLAKLEASGNFTQSLGIETLGYQDDIAATTARLVELLESGENILAIEGGPMEAIYRALDQTDPAYHANVKLLSHSGWNENRDKTTRDGVTEARTWADIEEDFPDVELIEIADQNGEANNDRRFFNKNWADLDDIEGTVAETAREAMTAAGSTKKNDASDAGMLWYALTGDEDGTAQDALAYLKSSGVFGSHDVKAAEASSDDAGDTSVFELAADHASPLSSATYNADTGALALEFDYDRLLQSSGEWGNARHIDAVKVGGADYSIEIHPDDGPRDSDGRYIYSRDTMENSFTINIGAGLDPETDDLTFELMDDYVAGDGVGQKPLYSFTLDANDAHTPGSDDSPTLVYALNAGGGAFTAQNGVEYQADTTGIANRFKTDAAISGTEDDALYQSEAWKKDGFTYEVDMGNGTFDVELNFSEIWSGAFEPGTRVFDIYVEDELVFDDLDVSDRAGTNAALDLIGEVTVTDGSLTIRTNAESQNPKLSGFSVWESSETLGDFTEGFLYDDLSF